ncbi:hypothetical protein [Mycoplasmopsis agassizii]|uniref:Lipoprotein n=1 Tax=Mycoplasmopsis agassizii TaxID=33922 RepID=A0ABX4H5A4_9BACT|nr:hypothetical protein [Mycoplasmopsis agassizii]PAF54958.1 hypothetical protein CJF60_04455 [Mycoplasmopsis agassizii]SMC16989.1 hypothetical protein SAMN02745179_00361 [Mycoplasmopsis agassizii]
MKLKKKFIFATTLVVAVSAATITFVACSQDVRSSEEVILADKVNTRYNVYTNDLEDLLNNSLNELESKGSDLTPEQVQAAKTKLENHLSDFENFLAQNKKHIKDDEYQRYMDKFKSSVNQLSNLPQGPEKDDFFKKLQADFKGFKDKKPKIR